MPRFEAVNAPGFLIRHRNFLGELTQLRSGDIADDFWFNEAAGNTGRTGLGSANFPGFFLRHRDFRIHLERRPATPAADPGFAADATFVRVPGLAGHGISFRSFTFPDHYLRHRDFHLFLDHEDTPNLAADATFVRTQPID